VALDALGQNPARPYDLRHSFASLLPRVTEELEDAPRIDAEAAIRASREG
jgi:hypothetical protein